MVAMAAEKNVVLILGDGGMMGIFVAGVLRGLDEKIRSRVRAVYGTSSGADVGAYFVSGQTDVPFRFFTDYLTRKDFCRKNFLRYLLKLFVLRRSRFFDIPDYINVQYVADIARHSDCQLDVPAFEKSDMGFCVKVIDAASGSPQYLPAKTNVFEKLMATSQCGPLSTRAIAVEGKRYIDGGTVPNDLDARLAREHADTLFIFVQSQGNYRLQKMLLYPLYLLAGHAISILYGKHIGKQYVRGLFADTAAALKSQNNVVTIENDLSYSSFCTDKEKLKRVYLHGVKKARAVMATDKL